jgi:hypothetical protein
MKLKIIFISGTLLGLTISALEFAKMYALQLDYAAFIQIAAILLIILITYALYRGIKEICDRFYDGSIKFSKAFLYGAAISFIAFFVVFLYLILHYSYIDIDGLQRFNENNNTQLTSVFAASLFFSFSVLLYGIFINLFVSMYVQRSKGLKG